MKISCFLMLFLGLFVTTAIAAPTITPPIKWERLGSKKVNYRIDRDVIRVGAHEGGFTKLKLVVTNGSLNMRRMVVEYMDGSKQEIAVRHQFTRRSTSRTIDLRGNRRLIKDITFWYDSKNASRQRATISVLGRH